MLHSARASVAVVVVALGVALVPRDARAESAEVDLARSQVKAAPADAAAGLALGRALRRSGDYDGALRELRRTASLEGARRGEESIFVHYETARVFSARRDLRGALAACKRAGAVAGGAAMGHACAAEALLGYKRATEALTEAELALASGARVFEAKLAAGIAHDLALEDGQAEQSLREAVAWRPDRGEGYVALGRFLARVGKREEALGTLRKAIEVDPLGADAAFELGSRLPPGNESIAMLERATKVRQGFLAADEALAEHALAVGDLVRARAAAEAAVKALPTDVPALTALGRVALAEGKTDAALGLAHKASSLAANQSAPRLLLADAQVKKGDIDGAIESFQQAHNVDKSNATILVRAGRACLAGGRLTTARAFADKATRDFPGHGPAWVALGDVLVAEGERVLGRAAYERAMHCGRDPQGKVTNDNDAVDAEAVKRKLDVIVPRG